MLQQLQEDSNVEDVAHEKFTRVIHQHATTNIRYIMVPKVQFPRNQHPIRLVVLHTIIANTINIHEKIGVRSKVVDFDFRLTEFRKPKLWF